MGGEKDRFVVLAILYPSTGSRTKILLLQGPPAVAVDSVESIKKFVEDNKVAIVGFFKDADSAAAKNFKSVAGEMDDQVWPLVLVEHSKKLRLIYPGFVGISFFVSIRNSASPPRLQFSLNMPLPSTPLSSYSRSLTREEPTSPWTLKSLIVRLSLSSLLPIHFPW